ncbi:YwqG family protein [Actinocatenispora comari]|uniref:DUF1963 domain-containing protein n=1 Tax=Actinocatenispora comari TaxID=2807577 RepID=A0A8J4EQQ2_9ACTN|nr:hypothetical protein [Actinocatenispora comari]GIL30069.1 hypothetical protein NUM_53230 [Actinocatenispora comari]
MVRHTPPRPVAVEELFPELVPLRTESVRLHPRRGTPTCRESSVGGPLLWPAAEPWPTCAEEHYEFEQEIRHDAAVPLVPIVQLFRRDAPSMPFPDGTDLLQVLWCPFAHGEAYCPRPVVWWRDSRSIGAVADTPAAVPDAFEDHVPEPCVVHPERVTEYPSWDLPDDLRAALADRFTELENDTGWSYHCHLSDAPGIKLGGYPGWTQDPYWPDCPTCGRRMEHLLTVASWEADGESWRTWLPVEDRDTTDGRTGPMQGNHVIESAGLMLGDAGGVYVFECRSCPDRPVGYWFDCS